MANTASFGVISNAIGLATQEMVQRVPLKNHRLFIGIPKELSFQENRIALVPEAVELLVNNGHTVVVETQAGQKAGFSDVQFSEAGAHIVYHTEQVYEADIILKVAPLTSDELQHVRMHQVIFSPLHLPAMQIEYLEQLIEKRATGIAYEYIKDESGRFPMVRALSEIAGSAAILIGAEYLSNVNNGKGILLGGIAGVPPARVIILGAGVVGEYATRTALGLGAEVRVFDNNTYKLMRLQNNVNVRVYTSIINPARLREQLATADLVVGAIHSELGRTPCIVSEEMVMRMKPGSVIVDVSIDQGGCFETSHVTDHRNPTFKKHDIIHYCVPNIASRVAYSASIALSNVLVPILQRTYDFGGFDNLLQNSAGARNGVYLYKGCLTNRHLSERFNLKYTNLELLMTATF
ncbi:MAG: alanine dehydrogenase [Chitinophagales bacterium]|nr:alanine dehydrogenase [Chitinophagales bacterium]